MGTGGSAVVCGDSEINVAGIDTAIAISRLTLGERLRSQLTDEAVLDSRRRLLCLSIWIPSESMISDNFDCRVLA